MLKTNLHVDSAWLNELPIETSKSAKQSGKGFVNKKLKNITGYSESLEFSPALVLITFRKKSVATKLDP